ncbi:hypothetical protein [Jiella sonneratiae]|uniref:Uncharacterized protein n=1 Tax=Jiella sonneratiae TaxID=2816856 RepID=A0ABS3J4R8_9HYPH|nr:hypothetical protein [Jiella sonneratiae]MBO0904666.1 hypothetical protein [Jiella sonneratiae]
MAARQKALQAPITDELRDRFTHLAWTASSNLMAALADMASSQNSVGQVAAKLNRARDFVLLCEDVLRETEACSAMGHDFRVYGEASAAEDDDEEAVGRIWGCA